MSTPPPIESEARPVPPPPPKVPQVPGSDFGETAHRLILWGMLITLVTVFVASHMYSKKPSRKSPKRSRISPEFQVSSRYAVGGWTLQRSGPADEKAKKKAGKTYRQQVETAAKSSRDRVALIPIIEEISGREEAVKYAKGLLKEFRTAKPVKDEEEKPSPKADDKSDKADDEPDAAAEKKAAPAKPVPDPKKELRYDTESFLTVLEQGPEKLEKKDRERLSKRYKWFADLALSSRAGDDDPVRSKALGRGTITLVILIVGVIGVFLGGLAGFVMLISWIVARFMGKVKMRYLEDKEAATKGPLVYFETFVLLLGAMIIIPALLLLCKIPGHWTVHAAMVAIVGWLVIRKVPWCEARRGLGWHGGKNPVLEVFCGICGYLAGLPIIVIGLVLTSALGKLIVSLGLDQVVSKEASHPIVEQLQKGGASRLIALGIMACVLAPLLEETFFRGAFYHYLRSRGGVFLAVVISAFVFAAIHPQSIAGIPALMSIGIVLAMIREWRGSVIASITAHACNNLIVVGLAIILLT